MFGGKWFENWMYHFLKMVTFVKYYKIFVVTSVSELLLKITDMFAKMFFNLCGKCIFQNNLFYTL